MQERLRFNAQQKKVILIAAIAIGILASAWCAARYGCFQTSEIEIEDSPEFNPVQKLGTKIDPMKKQDDNLKGKENNANPGKGDEADRREKNSAPDLIEEEIFEDNLMIVKRPPLHLKQRTAGHGWLATIRERNQNELIRQTIVSGLNTSTFPQIHAPLNCLHRDMVPESRSCDCWRSAYLHLTYLFLILNPQKNRVNKNLS